MVEQAKKVGTVFMYKELDMYEQKITEMLTYLMNSGDFLKVDKDGSVVINFPEKINVEKDWLGETKYYDLRNEECFEEIEKGEEIQEATEMTNVEKIRLAERTRYSIYGAGIEKILGLQEKMSNQEKENDEK